MDRRQFCAATVTLLAAAAADSREVRPMLPVIDTHQHLWDLAKFRLGWLKPGDALDASFTPEKYAEATRGLNVVQAVYMEVDVVPEQQKAEAEYVAELCRGGKTATRAAVVSGRPAAANFAEAMAPYKGHKFIKGVRQVLHVDSAPAGYASSPEFVKGIRHLGEIGLSFDLCARAADLPEMAKLVAACPGTRFILDHCGNPKVNFTAAERDAWKAGIGKVAANPNVVCKLSGFVANGPKGSGTPEAVAPYADAVIEAFGIGRVMFGGDWPVVTLAGTYADWLGTVRTVLKPRPEAEQRKVLHDNAAGFYGLG